MDTLPTTPTISDILGEMGIDGTLDGVNLVGTNRAHVVGRARVALVRSSNESGIPGLGRFIDRAPPGSFLVMAYEADLIRSTFGGLAARAAAARQCVGLVSNGWVRDVGDIVELNFPIWARGVTARSGKNHLSVTPTERPVSMLDVMVSSGDLIVADATGVCIVPAEYEQDVLSRGHSAEVLEEKFGRALDEGGGFGEASRRFGTL